MKRVAVTGAALLAVLVGAPANPASADQVRDSQWYLSSLHVRQAWQTTRGAGVTVCVIDSGIDDLVPDLRGAVRARKQFTKYVDADGLVTSHGTGVASVLAGRGHGAHGADGVIGIAPQATLLDAVVGDADPDIDQQAAEAIRWCTEEGAGVINMSFAVLSDGPMRAAVTYAESKDVVLVAASSNTFENLGTTALPNPAGLPGVLAVTGIDKDLRHDDGAFNSSVGKRVSLAAPFSTTSGANGYPEVGLPVADVRSAVARGTPYAAHACGTSYSSPIVAGAAALIRSADPKMSANDVIAALLATATPTGSGRPNRTYGWGILDVGAAVASTLQPSSVNPVITGKLPNPEATPTPTPVPIQPRATAAETSSPVSGSAGPSTSVTSRRRSKSSSETVWFGVLAGVALAAVGVTVALRRRRSRPR